MEGSFELTPLLKATPKPEYIVHPHRSHFKSKRMEAVSINTNITQNERPLVAKRFGKNRLKNDKAKRKKIALPTMEGLCFEKVKKILYLEANGNYTTLHFEDGKQTLVCRTLRDIEAMLPQESFVRIHRSHTVNLKHLKKYVRGKGGYVVLYNGASLSVSAGQRDHFLKAVQLYFC